MKYFKIILSIFAAICSTILLLYLHLFQVDCSQCFMSDVVATLIMSLVCVYKDIRTLILRKYIGYKHFLILFLCSFYLFISPIYLLLTTNIWTENLVRFTVLDLISYSIFLFVWLEKLLPAIQIRKIRLNILCAVIFLVLLVVNIIIDFIVPAVTATLCLIIVLSIILEDIIERKNKNDVK